MTSLSPGAPGETGIEQAFMKISSSRHLPDQSIMPEIKGFQPSLPPQDLGVAGIALLVLREDAPYGVEFAVLTEQVIPAQQTW